MNAKIHYVAKMQSLKHKCKSSDKCMMETPKQLVVNSVVAINDSMFPLSKNCLH